jgi:N-acyl-L-homoserine lactone synthetase
MMLPDLSCLVYERTQGNYKIQCTKNCIHPQIAEFVAQVYYRKFDFSISYSDLLKQLEEEDELYKDFSFVYAIYDGQDQLLATAKMIRFTPPVLLPIEKEFHIDLRELSNQMAPANEIWEVSRLSTRGNRAEVIKLLLKEGIYHCSSKDDIIVACIDQWLSRKLKRIGIPIMELGASKLYMGSLTCPVACSIHDLTGEFSYDVLHRD